MAALEVPGSPCIPSAAAPLPSTNNVKSFTFVVEGTGTGIPPCSFSLRLLEVWRLGGLQEGGGGGWGFCGGRFCTSHFFRRTNGDSRLGFGMPGLFWDF